MGKMKAIIADMGMGMIELILTIAVIAIITGYVIMMMSS